jgi:hypothetical protein
VLLLPIIIFLTVFGVLLFLGFGDARSLRRKYAKRPEPYPCADCGFMVSPSVTSCPQCGRSLQEDVNLSKGE